MGPDKNNRTSSFNTHASGTLASSLSNTELTRGDNTFLRKQDLTSAQISAIAHTFK